MKIFILGSDEVWSIERIYAKYIEAEGHVVKLIPSQSIFLLHVRSLLINRIFFRLGISGIYSRINKLIISICVKEKPDVVIVFKGMEVSPKTLEILKQNGIKLVNYNPDNPFLFTSRGSGNSNITKSINLYDLHFTYNLDIEKQLKGIVGDKVELLPFGYDFSNETLEIAQKEKEIIKVCFLGNPDSIRAKFICDLAERGVQLDVYGNGWNKFIGNHDSIKIYPPIYNPNFWYILRQYRVQINLMRIHNEDSHNMRSFEIPGIGGIMLAPNTTEHRMFFKEGTEAFFYNNVDDAAEKIEILLTMSINEAAAIRKNARARSVNDGYSYEARSRFVSNFLKDRFGK